MAWLLMEAALFSMFSKANIAVQSQNHTSHFKQRDESAQFSSEHGVKVTPFSWFSLVQ